MCHCLFLKSIRVQAKDVYSIEIQWVVALVIYLVILRYFTSPVQMSGRKSYSAFFFWLWLLLDPPSLPLLIQPGHHNAVCPWLLFHLASVYPSSLSSKTFVTLFLLPSGIQTLKQTLIPHLWKPPAHLTMVHETKFYDTLGVCFSSYTFVVQVIWIWRDALTLGPP